MSEWSVEKMYEQAVIQTKRITKLEHELKSAKQLLLNAVNPFASKMTAQELHTEILNFLQENK